jgi:hypothetical protein
MGAASTTKILKQNAGVLTEETTLTTSAGAGDANKVVALNASGVLDATIVNSKATSAGAGDAGKLAALNASGVLDDTIINATVTSSASKVVKLDASGKLDVTVMPTGIGADTAALVASEALAAGDLVNIWNSAGVANVRKADGSVSGKEAHGFVLSAFASAATATVYFEGTNTQCTGLTPGVQYLSGATAGKSAAAAPTGTGKVVQVVGFALSATSMNFQAELPIVLA